MALLGFKGAGILGGSGALPRLFPQAVEPIHLTYARRAQDCLANVVGAYYIILYVACLAAFPTVLAFVEHISQ